MPKPPPDTTTGLLETAILSIAEMRGEQRMQHDAIDRALDGITKAQERHTKHLAGLPCDRNTKRISEAVRAVRNGAARIDERRQIGARVVQIFAVIGALAALAGVVFAAIH